MNRRNFLLGFSATGAVTTTEVVQVEDLDPPAMQATTIASVADLRSISVHARKAIMLLGHSVVGDGGSGTFWWDEKSTEAENGGTIFASQSTTVGRWKRILGRGGVDISWFGAKVDGSADDTAAMLAAREFARALSPPRPVHVPGSIRLSSCDLTGISLSIDGYIHTAVGATIEIGGTANSGATLNVRIPLVYDGQSLFVQRSTPQIRISGGSDSRFQVAAGYVQLYADGNSDPSRRGMGYAIVDVTVCNLLEIYGANGGWVNSNIITGRIDNLRITGDGTYQHNDNQIRATIEGGDIEIVHGYANEIFTRMEEINSISFGPGAIANRIIKLYDDSFNPFQELAPITTPLSDLGIGNVVTRQFASNMQFSELARVPKAANTPNWTKLGDASVFVAQPGDFVLFDIGAPGIYRAVLQLLGASGQPIDDQSGTRVNYLSGEGWAWSSSFTGWSLGSDASERRYAIQLKPSASDVRFLKAWVITGGSGPYTASAGALVSLARPGINGGPIPA